MTRAFLSFSFYIALELVVHRARDAAPAPRARLEDTDVEAGRKLLQDSKCSLPTLQAATDRSDVAKEAGAAVAA